MMVSKERYKQIIERKHERNHRRAVVTARNNGICINCLKTPAFPGRLYCKDCINRELITERTD